MSSGKWRPFCLGLSVLKHIIFPYLLGTTLQNHVFPPSWKTACLEKPLSGPVMINLLTCIRVTWPQWVNRHLKEVSNMILYFPFRCSLCQVKCSLLVWTNCDGRRALRTNTRSSTRTCERTMTGPRLVMSLLHNNLMRTVLVWLSATRGDDLDLDLEENHTQHSFNLLTKLKSHISCDLLQ